MEPEKPKIRLRPVVYSTSTIKKGTPNTTQQIFLLKALQITSDPKKLREMIGVHSVAEVYRTLDKIAMRKEYHEALSRSGISFDYVVRGIKGIADTSEKDDVRLKAFQTILKSVGMEKYEDSAVASSGTWEEALLKKIEEEKKDVEPLEKFVLPTYDVTRPELPESAKRAQEEEAEMTSSIYDTDPNKK
jgi:hypothetical protein